jgi:hypothetical protein
MLLPFRCLQSPFRRPLSRVMLLFAVAVAFARP